MAADDALRIPSIYDRQSRTAWVGPHQFVTSSTVWFGGAAPGANEENLYNGIGTKEEGADATAVQRQLIVCQGGGGVPAAAGAVTAAAAGTRHFVPGDVGRHALVRHF